MVYHVGFVGGPRGEVGGEEEQHHCGAALRARQGEGERATETAIGKVRAGPNAMGDEVEEAVVPVDAEVAAEGSEAPQATHGEGGDGVDDEEGTPAVGADEGADVTTEEEAETAAETGTEEAIGVEANAQPEAGEGADEVAAASTAVVEEGADEVAAAPNAVVEEGMDEVVAAEAVEEGANEAVAAESVGEGADVVSGAEESGAEAIGGDAATREEDDGEGTAEDVAEEGNEEEATAGEDDAPLEAEVGEEGEGASGDALETETAGTPVKGEGGDTRAEAVGEAEASEGTTEEKWVVHGANGEGWEQRSEGDSEVVGDVMDRLIDEFSDDGSEHPRDENSEDASGEEGNMGVVVAQDFATVEAHVGAEAGEGQALSAVPEEEEEEYPEGGRGGEAEDDDDDDAEVYPGNIAVRQGRPGFTPAALAERPQKPLEFLSWDDLEDMTFDDVLNAVEPSPGVNRMENSTTLPVVVPRLGGESQGGLSLQLSRASVAPIDPNEVSKGYTARDTDVQRMGRVPRSKMPQRLLGRRGDRTNFTPTVPVGPVLGPQGKAPKPKLMPLPPMAVASNGTTVAPPSVRPVDLNQLPKRGIDSHIKRNLGPKVVHGWAGPQLSRDDMKELPGTPASFIARGPPSKQLPPVQAPPRGGGSGLRPTGKVHEQPRGGSNAIGGFISREQVARHLKVADKNGDQQLSSQELKGLYRSMGIDFSTGRKHGQPQSVGKGPRGAQQQQLGRSPRSSAVAKQEREMRRERERRDERVLRSVEAKTSGNKYAQGSSRVRA